MLKHVLSLMPVIACAGLIAACTPDGAEGPATGSPRLANAPLPPQGWFDVAIGKPQRSEKQGQAALADLRNRFPILASESGLNLVPGAGSRPEIRVQHVSEARAHEICTDLRQQRFTACKVLPRVD